MLESPNSPGLPCINTIKNQKKNQHLPCGEYILKWMGTFEIALVFPVMRSVSSAISFLTAAAIIWKCKNSSTKSSKYTNTERIVQ
jgi:hypothetical protein